MGTTQTWSRKHWWQLVVLSISGWCGFYTALILPMHFQFQRQIAAQRSSGLGAVAGYDPLLLWRQRVFGDVIPASRPQGVYFQKGGPIRASAVAYLGTGDQSASDDDKPADNSRKIVRNAALDLEVKSPAESAENIRALAESKGGYLVSSEVSGAHDSPGGTITIRVLAARYKETRDELKKLAVRVEAEKVEAKDMTVDYVDREARLRSLRAEEAQYLAIMRRANTVKDTLDVSGKLAEVRSTIEQQQAEFAALSKQVETVAIAIALHAEADAQIFGLHWRPMYEFKLAARDGLESLANYVAVMTAALFHLPAVLLWLATILLTAAITWRAMRWGWRKLLAPVHTGSTS
jgi:roadblock/LC7 domain-containing protein